MRLKRDSVLVLFKVMDAGDPSIIEAVFATPEAMSRYFVNHDLGRKHRLGEDGEIYPKHFSKKFKFYSLEEVKRKKKQNVEEAKPDEPLLPEDEETKESPLDELLEDEERPDAEEGDK